MSFDETKLQRQIKATLSRISSLILRGFLIKVGQERLQFFHIKVACEPHGSLGNGAATAPSAPSSSVGPQLMPAHRHSGQFA
jgi:hypothetical protein